MRTQFYQDTLGEWITEVVLSRRNVAALLAKADGHPSGSACALVGPTMYPCTIVRVEPDDVHYAHESREDLPPGPLHENTERHLPR